MAAVLYLLPCRRLLFYTLLSPPLPLTFFARNSKINTYLQFVFPFGRDRYNSSEVRNMNNRFGKVLRNLMESAGIKESQLADTLSYDATYISKWLNGSKLPSLRNVDAIIDQIADFLSRTEDTSHSALYAGRKAEIARALHLAYEKDSSYMAFQASCNNKLSFIKGKQSIIDLTRSALLQAAKNNPRQVTIEATFDLFRFFGDDMTGLMDSLKSEYVEKVQLKLALDPADFDSDSRFYTSSILNIIGNLDYIEMSILVRTESQPDMMVINDFFCLQLVWDTAVETAAVFSTDSEVTADYRKISGHILLSSDKIFDPAEPEILRKTNVQLDSYSDRRQWLFFNEPPAMLFPDEIMDEFIQNAESEDYANYLTKLKNVFSNHTSRSSIDLVLYSSMINQYLADGVVCVGNVEHRLTPDQVQSHLQYLNEVMKRNPNFHIWLIRNAVGLSEDLKHSPSIFIDTFSVYIENSNKAANDNFHISMDPVIRYGFQQAFERLLSQPYCTQLTADDLLRYI